MPKRMFSVFCMQSIYLCSFQLCVDFAIFRYKKGGEGSNKAYGTPNILNFYFKSYFDGDFYLQGG